MYSVRPPQMAMEIRIHKAVHHQHIVGFHSYFEDDQNIYIVLELCRRRVCMLATCSFFVCLRLFHEVLLCFPCAQVAYGAAQETTCSH